MPERVRPRLVLTACLLVGCITFATGIDWGLPSRDADSYIFGSPDRVWSGAQIQAARGPWKPEASRAADADANPIVAAGQVVHLNATAAQQAEIVQRYRLFSAQPDEMLTFMALAGMRANAFDPRMYQYGGLWIYPVGGLLKAASMTGAVTLRPGMDYYLDRPEAFGRFYIVARAYSAAWGLIGVWAVFQLVRRISTTLSLPATAAVCFTLMPIVINGAHEAKPHLAGTVLVLLAALAGTKFVEAGARRWWVMTGALCGMAAGMVLSAAVAFVVIPLMALLRGGPWAKRVKLMLAAGGVGVLVYCVTNPYVPINLVRNPGLVRANLGALGQAKALTGASNDAPALWNARRLVVDGASVVGGVIGILAVVVGAVSLWWWRENPRARVAAVLVGTPAALVLVQFAVLAGGKAGEFGRFAMLPDVALVMGGVVLAGQFAGVGLARRVVVSVVLVGLAGFQGASYVAGFWEDARGSDSSRRVVARQLKQLWERGARTLGVRAEPAPYCLPPVDVTGWKIVLVPGATTPPNGEWPDVIVSPVDEVGRVGEAVGTPYARTFVAGTAPRLKTRISWADKPFEILVKRDLARVP